MTIEATLTPTLISNPIGIASRPRELGEDVREDVGLAAELPPSGSCRHAQQEQNLLQGAMSQDFLSPVNPGVFMLLLDPACTRLLSDSSTSREVLVV